MTMQHFFLVFLFVLYLLPICCCISEPVPTSGPYKSAIVSATNCGNPIKPYLKNSPIIFHSLILHIDGKNILSGNLTILNDTMNVKLKIKSFVWHNSQWHQAHMLTNLNCHGLLMQLTFKAIRVKYDPKNCLFFKGVYSFPNMDVNLVQHIWTSTMPYGRVLWRSEVFSDRGMFICKEFETIIEPAYHG